MELEYAAARAEGPDNTEPLPFDLREDTDGMLLIDLAPSIRALTARRDSGENRDSLPLCFHVTVYRLITDVCLRLRGVTDCKPSRSAAACFRIGYCIRKRFARWKPKGLKC